MFPGGSLKSPFLAAGFMAAWCDPDWCKKRLISMPVVNFVNEKKQVLVPENANLRKAALEAGVGLYPGIHKALNCHGFGHCGACRVLVHEGRENASKMGWMERLRLKLSMAFIGHEDEMRLACQTRVCGDMDVETRPPLNLFGENFFS